jgi:Flp pilus assembly protein TadD/cold shock CspA family protein
MVIDQPITKDPLYVTRHPLIAKVVFERILTDPEERFQEYVRILDSLNIAFKTDRDAYRRLVRGRALLDLFPDHEMAEGIFRKAQDLAGDDAYVFHQHGVYELNRAKGSLDRAFEYLARAREMSPRDATIVHSLAEVELARSERARTAPEREYHREQGTKLANLVRDDPISGSFAYHTLIKISLGRLRDLLISKTAPSLEVENALREVEGLIELGLQKFPGSEFLITAEADLGSLVKDNERAKRALESAFRTNPRSPFIANRLAKAYLASGEERKALSVLEKALEESGGEKQLHFSMALLLMKRPQLDKIRILHHLRNSFTKGDQNREAKFWYAVFLFMEGTREKSQESKEIFRSLRELPIPRHQRAKMRHIWGDADGKPIPFVGRVMKKEASYGFIEREGSGDWIYVREENVVSELWGKLHTRDRVTFLIGFDYGGPTAIEVAQA